MSHVTFVLQCSLILRARLQYPKHYWSLGFVSIKIKVNKYEGN